VENSLCHHVSSGHRCSLVAPHPPRVVAESPPYWSQVFADYFIAKVSNIKLRAATLASQLVPDAPSSNALVNSRLEEFPPVTTDEVRLLLGRTADKSSSLDVIPTWLLKKLTTSIPPRIAELTNITFRTCTKWFSYALYHCHSVNN